MESPEGGGDVLHPSAGGRGALRCGDGARGGSLYAARGGSHRWVWGGGLCACLFSTPSAAVRLIRAGALYDDRSDGSLPRGWFLRLLRRLRWRDEQRACAGDHEGQPRRSLRHDRHGDAAAAEGLLPLCTLLADPGDGRDVLQCAVGTAADDALLCLCPAGE